MRDAILSFPKQFRFVPKVENGPVKKYKKYIVAGMGGSHLAADILKTLKPELDIIVHSDYGLPAFLDPSRPSATLPSSGEGGSKEKRLERRISQTLLIASSYSGNTEETLDAFEQARSKGIAVAAIAVGGKLLELAKQYQTPYVQMPDTGIQPRSALGFNLRALLKIMKQGELLRQSRELAKSLQPKNIEEKGRALAQKLKSRMPVIYASQKNYSLAYNWKIKFNETGKIPTFYNIFPELNHNEMSGFSAAGGPASGGDAPDPKSLSEKFYFLFLHDSSDHPQIQKRMDATAKLYRERGLPVEILPIQGENAMHKIFSSLVLADWAALYTAEGYGFEAERVPMVEEFKKLIK